MKSKHQPIFHIVKREGTRWYHLPLSYFFAIAVALILGAILLGIQNVPAGTFYKNMFTAGTLGNKFAYKNFEGFIRLFVPLLITSVSLSLAFRMKFWNIGGEGQFIIGALCAGFMAYKFGGILPSACNDYFNVPCRDARWRNLWSFRCCFKNQIQYKRDAYDTDAQLHCAVSSALCCRDKG